jgi:hypothetical protein
MAETHAEYMARRQAELSGGNDTYGSGAVQTTAPASTFQPAVNPQPQGALEPAGSTSATTPSYDPAAAARAAEEAQKTNIRGSISSLIDQALGVYDTLYGNVRGAAGEQAKSLEGRYARETGSLTDQFNVELPKIGRAYAGRGAYDSSYRIEGEQEAGRGFQNQLAELGEGLTTDKAKIAADLATQEGQLSTGKSLLDLTRSRLGEVTDVNELSQLQSEIQAKIAELQGSVAGTQSQSALVSKFGELAPASDRMPQLTATLTSIVNGQAPGALKRAVAAQIIGSSGLPKEEQDKLTAQITQQIG